MNETEDQYIVVNQILCKKCGDMPYSRNRHDYVVCNCGAVGVDGGQAYLRRAGNPEDYQEMSYCIPKKAMLDAIMNLEAAQENDRNSNGQVNAVIRALRGWDIIRATGE